MKSIIKQSSKKAAFTIVELLVVMSIIMVLMGILLPAFNQAKRYARKLSQRAQFHSIDAGLEMFKNDFETYPDSGSLDLNNEEYPGAMKLAEAMMGQDLLGFHPESHFNCDDEQPPNTAWPRGLYPDPFDPENIPEDLENLRVRRGPYVTVENARAHKLRQLYAGRITGVFSSCGEARYLLCDVYARITNRTLGVLPEDGGDRKIGMPILYYKANVSNILHDVIRPSESIYDYRDNHRLVELGMPWEPTAPDPHPLWQLSPGVEGELFYKITKSKDITVVDRPVMDEEYILISAGYDGLYGTDDDVFNFGK